MLIWIMGRGNSAEFTEYRDCNKIQSKENTSKVGELRERIEESSIS